MASLLRDTAFAVRTLRKHPGFAITGILTLALGIGATTAIFSVVNAVLLKPLPYDHPERLTILWGELRTRDVYDWSFSPPNIKLVQDRATVFDGVAGVATFTAPLIVDGIPPLQIRVAQATTNIFPVLGVHVARGRDFTPNDGLPSPFVPPAATALAAPATPPAPPLPAYVVLSDEFWRRQYGADPSIIGKTMRIGGAVQTVVGILAPGVELDFPPNEHLERAPDVWWAARMDFVNSNPANVGWFVVARMKPGISVPVASADVDRISADMRAQNAGSRSVNFHMRAEGMQDNVVASVRPILRALAGAVLFVLLIACANVANLLLVRVSARERELAVRAAIGGSPGAILRQLLAESFVLSAAGGVLGVALAYLGVAALPAMAPADLPRMDGVSVNLAVLGFAALACVASAVIFGLVPAIRASRPDLVSALRAGGRGSAGGGSNALRTSVVIAEVALAFVLLVGCGLMVRSAIALAHVSPGFDAQGLLTLRVGNFQVRGPDEFVAKTARMREALAGLPGVTDVAVSSAMPLDGTLATARWGTRDALADPTKYHQGNINLVSPTYFSTLRARLVAGRAFTDADNVPNNHSVIIDDRIAAMAYPNESPIGKPLMARVNSAESQQYEIVGVVPHIRHTSLVGDEKETAFYPVGSIPGAATGWTIRTSSSLNALGASARSALRLLDPQLLITDVQPEAFYVRRAMAPTRFVLALIGMFAALAAILASIGLYGVLSSMVRQRVPEIGIRMAFGALPSNVFRLIIGRGLGFTAVGLTIGLVGGLALTRMMTRLLVSVRSWDPATYAVTVMVFLGIAALACWSPARRAAAVEPNVALREE